MGYFARHRIFGNYTRQLALTGSLLALSSANYGFDNQGFGSTQAMDPFIREFGERQASGKYAIPPYFLSLLNSLVFIGFAIGAVIGSIVSNKFGRRMCIFAMSIWALVTAVLLATSKSKEQILIARILNYIYVGMELSVIPVMQAEIMPAPVRGFAVATYQFSLIFGGIIINSICRGTSTLKTDLAWQIPYALYVVIPSIVASLIWFVPESPRWLMMVGREEDARVALSKYMSGAGVDVDAEIELLRRALDEEKDRGTYRELFTGINRKRTLVVIGTNFFLQSTGQAFSAAYGAVFIKQLGTINPFNMTIVNSVLGAVAIALSMLFVDRVGRRRIMIIGVFLQGLFAYVMGGLGVKTPVSVGRRNAIVAMVSLFGMGFNGGWAANSYVVCSEIPAQRLRDKTQRLGAIVNITTNFVVAFTIPYLLNKPYADLQSKVGFIYGSFAFLAVIFGILCIPECKGKSLEEIEALFAAGTPLRKFGSSEAPAGTAAHQLSELEAGHQPTATSIGPAGREKDMEEELHEGSEKA